MTQAVLEHANISVSDPAGTAGFLCDIFGWKIRWSGDALNEGRTIHVGGESSYLALYSRDSMLKSTESSYQTIGAINHVGVVVDDLDEIEVRVKASGMKLGAHYDYEPGRRFYFYDFDGIEYEVVSYAPGPVSGE